MLWCLSKTKTGPGLPSKWAAEPVMLYLRLHAGSRKYNKLKATGTEPELHQHRGMTTNTKTRLAIALSIRGNDQLWCHSVRISQRITRIAPRRKAKPKIILDFMNWGRQRVVDQKEGSIVKACPGTVAYRLSKDHSGKTAATAQNGKGKREDTMATIFDVARRIHMLRPRLTINELHRLCFFAQGWHAAWTGRPLFAEEMQAWEHGPVSPELHRLSTVDSNNHVTNIGAGSANKLSDYGRDVVDRVEAFYTESPTPTRDGVSRQYHSSSWKNARGSLSNSESCPPIPVSDIRKEFTLCMWDNERKPRPPARLPLVSPTQLTQARKRAEIAHKETLQGLALV